MNKEMGIVLSTNTLDNLLNYFDSCIKLKVTLLNGETFYFERRIDGKKYTVDEINQLDLKLYNSFGCVKKPYKTEDYVEVKANSIDGKIRFLIWCADIFFKYNSTVPDFIRQKVLIMCDFDVLSRHNDPMLFMDRSPPEKTVS